MWPGAPMGTSAPASCTSSGSQLQVPLSKYGEKQGIHQSDIGIRLQGRLFREIPSFSSLSSGHRKPGLRRSLLCEDP